MPNDPTPFAEDSAICTAAEQVGMVTSRRKVVEINERELHPAYLRTAPDWTLIRKHLEDGINVPGAKLTGQIEYVIRHRPARNVQDAMREDLLNAGIVPEF